MWIQAFGLSCLLTFLEAQRSTPAPYIPECNDMDTAAKHLERGIYTALRKNSDCKRNIHCTGVKCTWSGGGHLEVDLHHCHDPVNYHIAIKAPSKNLLKNVSVQEGDSINLFKKDKVGEVKLHVKKLSRTGNIVSTSVELEGCLVIGCRTIASMVDQKFCVRMQNCPGFNASTADYKPCHFTPTSTGHTSVHIQTDPDRSTSSATGNIDARKGGSHEDDSSLSTAAIIGICAAGVFAILVVIGAVVYWKKYHHRSRLRAAYYNDISMHDPLYEDFGPEVA